MHGSEGGEANCLPYPYRHRAAQAPCPDRAAQIGRTRLCWTQRWCSFFLPLPLAGEGMGEGSSS